MLSGEERIIEFFRPLARHPGALGLIDDCAALMPPPGMDLVLKTDAIVGTVHFFTDDLASDVARKALRVNLSDLAAKGAKPLGFLLTLALPRILVPDWLSEFARGLGDDAEAYDCPLLGGDTVQTPGPVTVSIAVLGVVPKGTMVRRDTACRGDHVVVTGTIGDAALGLQLRHDLGVAAAWRLRPEQTTHLLQRYRLPQPRNILAEAIRNHARAGMDISDGLVGDLGKLCAASGVSAVIETAHVPLSAGARTALQADAALLEAILAGGDDYEILATVDSTQLGALLAAGEAAGVPVTAIGRIQEGNGVTVAGNDGTLLSFKQESYSHF